MILASQVSNVLKHILFNAKNNQTTPIINEKLFTLFVPVLWKNASFLNHSHLYDSFFLNKCFRDRNLIYAAVTSYVIWKLTLDGLL